MTRSINNPADFWVDLRAVIEEILSPRRGPGVLLVAKDVFSQVVPRKRRLASEPREPLCASQTRQSASGPHRAARTCGGSGHRRGFWGACRRARDQLVTVARLTQTPVVTTLSDVAAFPADDPLYLGVVGTAGHPLISTSMTLLTW